MTLYTIDTYVDGERENILVTSNKNKLNKIIGETIENDFDEFLWIIGYNIPEEIEKQYNKDINKIYEQYILNESIEKAIIFETKYDKNFLQNDVEDYEEPFVRVCEIPVEELSSYVDERNVPAFAYL